MLYSFNMFSIQMDCLWIFCTIMFSHQYTTEGKHVLFIPFPQKAYVNTQIGIMQELLNAGHEVSVVMGKRTAEYVDFVALEGLTVFHYDDKDGQPYHQLQLEMLDVINSGQRFDSFWNKLLNKFMARLEDNCHDMMSDESFLKQISSAHFDVAYVDMITPYPCALLLPYNLSIPYVSYTIVAIPWHMGVPALPSFVPSALTPMTDRMSFLERVLNTLTFVALELLPVMPAWNKSMLNMYGAGVKSWDELLRKSLLFVVERDHMLEWPTPYMPHVIRVPGTTIKPAGPLPQNLQHIMDSSKNGVIFISFGSIYSSLSPAFINRYIASIPEGYDAIVSYKGDVSALMTIPQNVHIVQWAPQNDILGHGKTKLFINHGGHRGQSEAVYHGVPMISTGIQREQVKNSYQIQAKGYGLTLDFYTFTPDEMKAAILEVLTNSKYAEKIKKMSAILKDDPVGPSEVIAQWIIHVATFGGEHLRPSSLDLPLYEFLLLDVLAFIMFVSSMILLVMYYVIKRCCRYLAKRCKSSKEKEN